MSKLRPESKPEKMPGKMHRGRPSWWPENEQWPPSQGAGERTWAGFRRRIVRFVMIWFLLVIALPLLIAVILAVTIGGWTSVAIVAASWIGLAIVLAVGLRVGLRSWYPVRSLIGAAGRLADGDYTARAEASGRAPVRQAVGSFNRMAERLEQAETERRRLLADVGHELRTPLTIIRGELEAMADGVHEPDETELRRLLGDVDVMERLLDDLATLSTAEAGMLTIHREPTELVRLVTSVVDGLGSEAKSKGVTVTVSAASDEIDANVDPIRVTEITTNVVANALRAAPAGGQVAITVDRVSPATDTNDGDAGDALVIRVTDTGHGVPPDEVDRVFDRFHKGPGSSGSGLGLTISRKLAVAHGGDITLTSDEGEGTTVTVTLENDSPR